MSRYIKEFQISCNQDTVFSEISQYLVNAENYEYREYHGEWVFKKGIGAVAAPSFIKVTFSGNTLRLEAWIKFAVLPGVYAGEEDLTGAMGFAVKNVLETRVHYVESIISKYMVNNTGSMAGAPVCPMCRRPIHANASFCSSCGYKLK